MRFITLQEPEVATLEEVVRHHPNPFFRKRCQCMLFSHQGESVADLASLFKTRTRTIYTWLDRWERVGLMGLKNLPGQGRPSKLDITNQEELDQILSKVNENPSKLSEVAQEVSGFLGRRISSGMLKKLLKKRAILGNASVNG